MAIGFQVAKLKITRFRGIKDLEVEFHSGVPSFLVGPNNAGKSTVLSALALAFRGGGFHTFSPEAHDFFHSPDGAIAKDFEIDVEFRAPPGGELPAVQGVGNPTAVHGLRTLGRTTQGRFEHRHVLLDEKGNAITISPRTPLKGAAKQKYKEHKNLGWTQFYARLDDIRDSLPQIWLLSPDNLERSLYSWQTGPLQQIAKILSKQFLETDWKFTYDKKERKMPDTLKSAHDFFRASVAEFPFWKDEIEPKLAQSLKTYLGENVKLGLQPDIMELQEWLQQQLAVSFAAEAGGPLIPLPRMGRGWQALVRLAALEVIESFSEASPTPVVLLCEEPEVYLHPHLSRKLRSVLAGLAEKNWLVLVATHASELISFNESQHIIRIWRQDTSTSRGHLLTSKLPEGPKFQSRLDERGNHELVLANRLIFCEGKDDVFAIRSYLDDAGVDLDARGVSILDVGGCSNEPDYARMARSLGIPWCGVTDEDVDGTGAINPTTKSARDALAVEMTECDELPIWKGSLEACLKRTSGKATPEWQVDNVFTKTMSEIHSAYPRFVAVVEQIRSWIDE